MSKRDEILDVAEAMIREKGYNGVSARGVADAIDIKSSSVHYYFPNKTDMVSAVLHRYTDTFMQALGPTEDFSDSSKDAVLEHYISVFRRALTKDKKLCLCAVLGAETGGVPGEVNSGTKEFFNQNIKWLVSALESKFKHVESVQEEKLISYANHVLASLEGAMIIAQTMGDIAYFDRVTDTLKSLELT